MKTQKIVIRIDEPILPGTISTARAKCGKKTCRCHQDPKHLHGPYYRWTGWIDGKATTKTLTKKLAEECERRIKNYRQLQKNLESLVSEALANAPWIDP